MAWSALATMQGSTFGPVCDGSGHVRNQAVKAIAFHPDGDYMVSAGNDDTAVMWSVTRVPHGEKEYTTVKTGPVIWHDSDVWDVSFDKSASYMATISWDGSIRVFDAATWKPLQIMRGHTPATRTVRFDPTSQYLISAAMDNTARVWSPFASLGADADFSHRFPRLQADGAHRVVRSLAFGPSAEWVALTDGRHVFLKPAKGPIRSLVAQHNTQGPRPEYSQIDTGGRGHHRRGGSRHLKSSFGGLRTRVRDGMLRRWRSRSTDLTVGCWDVRSPLARMAIASPWDWRPGLIYEGAMPSRFCENSAGRSEPPLHRTILGNPCGHR